MRGKEQRRGGRARKRQRQRQREESDRRQGGNGRETGAASALPARVERRAGIGEVHVTVRARE